MKTCNQSLFRWMVITAFVSGLGGIGYRILMGSTVATGGFLWFILVLAMAMSVFGGVLGFFQGRLLYGWLNSSKALILMWVKSSIIGWGIGGLAGGVLVILTLFMRGFTQGYEVLLEPPPIWIVLLSGIVGSTRLQMRVIRQEFANPRKWWWSNLLGWGGGFLLFLGLNKWLPFEAHLTGALSGLVAGAVIGIITGITLRRMIAVRDNSDHYPMS